MFRSGAGGPPSSHLNVGSTYTAPAMCEGSCKTGCSMDAAWTQGFFRCLCPHSSGFAHGAFALRTLYEQIWEQMSYEQMSREQMSCEQIFCHVNKCLVSKCSILWTNVMWTNVLWTNELWANVLSYEQMSCEQMFCEQMFYPMNGCHVHKCSVLWTNVLWTNVSYQKCYVVNKCPVNKCVRTFCHLSSDYFVVVCVSACVTDCAVYCPIQHMDPIYGSKYWLILRWLVEAFCLWLHAWLWHLSVLSNLFSLIMHARYE